MSGGARVDGTGGRQCRGGPSHCGGNKLPKISLPRPLSFSGVWEAVMVESAGILARVAKYYELQSIHTSAGERKGSAI